MHLTNVIVPVIFIAFLAVVPRDYSNEIYPFEGGEGISLLGIKTVGV